MKKLEKLILVQYFVCEAEEILINGHTAFLGPNGTGKSALLDAIQIAMLGADMNQVRFNVRSTVKDERSLRDYCLGAYRPPQDGDRANSKNQRCRSDAHTYITLVFGDDATGEKVSAGVAINAREKDDRHHVRGHYVVRGLELSLDDHLQVTSTGQAPLPWGQFEAGLRTRCAAEGVPGGVIHEGAGVYVKELLHALQPSNVTVDPDEFRKAFKKSLALRDMENVSDLVRTFVIDAQAIDRQRASSQILHFRQLEETVKKIGEEIAELQGCEDAYKLQQDTARQMAAYDALRYILQVEALQGQIADVEDAIEEMDRAGGPSAEKIRQLESVRDQAQQRLVDHTASMQSSAPQLALLSRKKDLNAARVAASNTSSRFRSVLSRQYVAVAAVRKFSAELSDELSAQFRDLEGRYNRRSEQAAAMLPEECRSWIDETCGPLQEAHRRLSKVRARVSGDAVKANAEVDAIRQQIAHAESGGSRLDQTAARALLILNKANLDARPVCEMVRVRDPAWQPAIEAYLGRNVFSFLLPDETAEHRAVRIAKDGASRLNGAKIVRTRLIPEQFYADPRPNMVSSLLESDDASALAYLRMQLGSLRMMHSDADLDEEPNGLSIDGVVNKDAASQPRELPAKNHLVLGRSASDEDLGSLRAELADAARKAGGLEKSASELEALLTKIAVSSMPEHLQETLASADTELEKASGDVAKIEEDIRALESGEAGEIARIHSALDNAWKDSQALLLDAITADSQRVAARNAKVKELENLNKAANDAALQEKRAREDVDYDGPYAYTIRQRVDARHADVPEAERDQVMVEYCVDRHAALAKQYGAQADRARDLFTTYHGTRDHDISEIRADWHRCQQWVSQRRTLLVETDLVNYEAQATAARSAAEEAFRRDVVFKLRDGITSMRATIDQLNRILKGCPPFSNGETYKFTAKPAGIHADLHRYIMNSGVDERGDLFNENLELAQTIMEYLVPTSGAAPAAVNPLEDFRLMFDYDLEISVDGVPTSSLSKRMGLGSNGEHLCPFHVIVAVALKHAYRLEPEKRAGGLCLMMLDEAFNAMDDQNALSAAKFISDLGLQLIMAAPSADSGKLSAFTNTIYELDRWDDVLEFHREEISEKAHALLKGDMPALNPELVRQRAEELARAPA